MPDKTSSKERRSFTLSRASILYLEQLQGERKISSASRVLDELIREEEVRRRRGSVKAAISDYYEHLSEPERREQASRGRFAFAQLRSFSVDVRNMHERTDTVFAVPLTTLIYKSVRSGLKPTCTKTGRD